MMAQALNAKAAKLMAANLTMDEYGGLLTGGRGHRYLYTVRIVGVTPFKEVHAHG